MSSLEILEQRSNIPFPNRLIRSAKFYRDLIAFLFVGLFGYTAEGKLLTLNTFQRVLLEYPLIGSLNMWLSYFIPITELAVCLLLILPMTRRLGLIFSLALMVIFLGYILFMFAENSGLPCSCGGFIAKLSWQQHIWFNSIWLLLGFIGLRLCTQPKRKTGKCDSLSKEMEQSSN